MSSKYWPPASLATEGNTSDIPDRYGHCCSRFNGAGYIEDGFLVCRYCHQKVLDTDEQEWYYNTMKGRGSPAP